MPGKIRVRYRRARVSVRAEIPPACEACGRKGRLEMHHYLYAHETSKVRAAPSLALDNSVWLCFTCHRLADMWRKMIADKERTEQVFHALMKKTGVTDANG